MIDILEIFFKGLDWILLEKTESSLAFRPTSELFESSTFSIALKGQAAELTFKSKGKTLSKRLSFRSEEDLLEKVLQALSELVLRRLAEAFKDSCSEKTA